jgi:hypothetical protein
MLSSLTSLVIPPQIKVALKLVPYSVIAALAMLLAVKDSNLKQTRTVLDKELEWRGGVAVALGSTSEDDALHIRVLLDAALAESAQRKEALERISREAKEANERSAALDAELKRTQEENSRHFEKAQRIITDLERRKPTGNFKADCELMAKDILTAWEGFR